MSNPTQPAAVPYVDPRLGQIAGQATQVATDYRKNIPTYESQADTYADNQARQTLAQSLYQNKANASARGFLYSGMKQGADVASQGQYAQGLAQQKANINQQFMSNANDLDNSAINTGLTAANAQSNYNQAGQDLSSQLLQLQLGNIQNQSTAYQQAAQGAGTAVGLLGAGSGKSPSSNPYTSTPSGAQTNLSAPTPYYSAPASSGNGFLYSSVG